MGAAERHVPTRLRRRRAGSDHLTLDLADSSKRSPSPAQRDRRSRLSARGLLDPEARTHSYSYQEDGTWRSSSTTSARRHDGLGVNHYRRERWPWVIGPRSTSPRAPLDAVAMADRERLIPSGKADQILQIEGLITEQHVR
jgi:hypothetical protein